MTFLISMVPVVELRGAIPVGIGLGIEPLTAAILSVIGNMIPVPFIILFIRSILSWLRKRSPRLNAWVTRLEEKTQIKAEKVQRYEKIGLLLFVAIPLPGTGAWTGALIAAMLDMRLKSAVPMIFLGILIAATIVTMLTIGIIRL
ncbi:MAG: COG2426 family protein [Anaerovoracaceae bacterium]|jgi:uncharacterized membrane protein